MGFLIWFLWRAVRQIGLFHFTNENTDSERLSNLCKFTQLVSGRVRICTFIFRPAYWIQCSPPPPEVSWWIVVEKPSCLFLRGTEHFSKTNILLEESLRAGSWLETLAAGGLVQTMGMSQSSWWLEPGIFHFRQIIKLPFYWILI